MARRIILVHGSFHDGRCWFRLAPILRGRGFEVHTPTLPGQPGHPRHPLLVSIRGYADHIVRLAGSLDGPSILLGHSLAGFAIAAAAERAPALFDRLIFLSAAIPGYGRSGLRDTLPPRRRTEVRFVPRALLRIPAGQAGDMLHNRCPPELRAQGEALLVTQPLRPLLGRIRTSRARLGSVRCFMLACADDRVLSLDDQLARRDSLDFEDVEVLDSDHSLFLCMPDTLADAIERIADRP